ncbi:MAG: TrbI/VirB10 family protein [Alphaproteobacteria bacterium]|nr:TrbI/VirB10 family protein [Alphaproteobacteria bacterium]
MTDNSDNENNDEFLEPEIGAPEEESKPSGVAGNIREAWNTRPFFKFMVLLVAVFAVGVAAINFFGGNSANSELARLGTPPATLKEAPGGPTSPYVKAQTEMANKERTDQAIATGGSAIPTPIGQTSNISGLDSEKKEDPLRELRVETDELKKQIQQQKAQQQQFQQQQVQQQQRPPEQFDNSLAEAMQRQMQQLLESWTPKGIKNVTVIKPEDLKNEEKAAQAAAGTPAQAAQLAPSGAKPKAFVSAGTVSYAQLLTEANSDVPGPILAQIVSGPLTGARAIGSFQEAMGYDKYLVMRFSIADKNGKDYKIDAYALDPDTTLGGMATEVDERYFARVILPAAAGFLQGLGQAMGQGNVTIENTGTATITTQGSQGFRQGMYNGMGTAATTMGSFFQNQANLTKPLVRVAAGTAMGMFFVAPVYDPSVDAGSSEQNAVGAANTHNNANGYANANYPGTTVNGYGNSQNTGNVPYPNYATAGNRNSNQAFGAMPQYMPASQNYGQNYGQ